MRKVRREDRTMLCEHIYNNMNANPCPKCGGETHETDWAYQWQLMQEWKKDNPNAKYEGWWSI